MLDPEPVEPTRKPIAKRWHALTLFGGVILPAISIAVEATTHICADVFFDPIPTVWHLLLVIVVPLTNLQVWLAVIKGQTERGTLLGLTNAVAIGISIFYSIVYIPLLPLALIALIYAGLGLLPLAPFLALIAGIMLRLHLRRVVTPKSTAINRRGLLTGLGLVLITVTLIELPVTLTRIGLQMATSDSPARRANGLRLLRSFGSNNYLLLACYGRTGRATDLIGYLFSLPSPVTSDEARQIYYRVSGETFDTFAPPKRVGGRWIGQDFLDFDPEQGGTTVAGKLKGLSLSSSRIDGSADADAGLTYLEWTLNFKNASDMQREARSEIQLPPGGFVSRLTLWVNGEEREAAFAGRSQVREAYEKVVRTRRDPVLVTTTGRDRVLVQCFPVPPQGGEMKVRIGITAPLVLENESQGRLLLPYFRDSNFRVPNNLTHAVWIESKTQLQTDSKILHTEQPSENLHAVRGALQDAELLKPESTVRMSRTNGITEVWTRNTVKGDKEIVRQSIREKQNPARSKVVVVVDTSRAMQESVREIAAALQALPRDRQFMLLLADGNGEYAEGESQKELTASGSDLARKVYDMEFIGGADNVPALARAWDLAAQDPANSAIVWIHSPQRLQLQPVEHLRQRWERRPDGPKLYAIQTVNGFDRIEEKLDGVFSFESVARTGSLQSDLEKLFAHLTSESKTLEFVRSNEKLEQPPNSANTKETSAHLARLWANDQVRSMMSSRDDKSIEAATQLAVAYQLVTPVSGAVVLETQEQYTAANLKPVDAGTVPTIPEPEMVLLIAIVAAILLFLLYRQQLMRRASGHTSL
ncbi:MAG TPA: VIT domain-containing protein [Pyrinomonadaceae bacterium]|nr:VIT domain-containing protein [Pyrinomonadaceae bacterium]